MSLLPAALQVRCSSSESPRRTFAASRSTAMRCMLGSSGCWEATFWRRYSSQSAAVRSPTSAISCPSAWKSGFSCGRCFSGQMLGLCDEAWMWSMLSAFQGWVQDQQGLASLTAP